MSSVKREIQILWPVGILASPREDAHDVPMMNMPIVTKSIVTTELQPSWPTSVTAISLPPSTTSAMAGGEILSLPYACVQMPLSRGGDVYSKGQLGAEGREDDILNLLILWANTDLGCSLWRRGSIDSHDVKRDGLESDRLQH